MSVTAGNLAARRQAALERLYGDDIPVRRRPEVGTIRSRNGSSRNGSSRNGSSRNGAARPRRASTSVPLARRSWKPSLATDLAPPSGTWYAILGIVLGFVMLGLVMVLSASAATQANLGNSPYGVFVKQAMWAGFGGLGMIVMARTNYTAWRRPALLVPIVVIAVLAMLGPFAPGIGSSVNGARAWIRIGGFSIQPSEFLKLVCIIATADLLTRGRNRLADRRHGLYPVAVIAALGSGLCLAQKDLGSAIVLGGLVLGIAWAAGLPLVPLAGLSTLGASAALVFVATSQSRIDRFTAFMNATEEKDHLAYQTYQGFVSMASGGLTGSGIGRSNGKLGYLPYAHSDFIFAVIADELGLIGAGVVIIGFMFLVGFGVQAAIAAPDRFGTLVAGGISIWFGLQAIVNLGGVTGTMPVTGLTLPFFSAGGSSLFSCMLAAGLLLSVARRAGAEVDPTAR